MNLLYVAHHNSWYFLFFKTSKVILFRKLEHIKKDFSLKLDENLLNFLPVSALDVKSSNKCLKTWNSWYWVDIFFPLHLKPLNFKFSDSSWLFWRLSRIFLFSKESKLIDWEIVKFYNDIKLQCVHNCC